MNNATTEVISALPAELNKKPEKMISIKGARQNNLKNLSVDIPTGQLVVVTGVSGSGKSSLVFDTLYAEGQRRYIETFSPYARQFLDRMDRPQVDKITGIPPAIAIDQSNPVRTSRSTVGTMTELNDHLKLLFARTGRLFCRHCAHLVEPANLGSIFQTLSEANKKYEKTSDQPLKFLITFSIELTSRYSQQEILELLSQQGYTRIHSQKVSEGNHIIEVVQDRFTWSDDSRSRIMEALEAALRLGQGKLTAYSIPPEEYQETFSTRLECPHCLISYQQPSPSSFSFNSPIGACETCRGFGRVIGVNFDLVIPDSTKTLRQGAVKPWQTPSFKECQDDLIRHGSQAGIALDTPWHALSPQDKNWVLEGANNWKGNWTKEWFGVTRFFTWLESKSYKMHIRVLLSKYRAYTACTACRGARLKPEALLWRVGNLSQPASMQPFMPNQVDWSEQTLKSLPGLSIQDMMMLPISELADFFERLSFPGSLDEAMQMLLKEIRSRLHFLCEVGLSYLNLDRQSRSLSGGEVQRINLTTALGTSLANTLFVLDEPSIGLHPRDVQRLLKIMYRLRDAGNSLVVVEHDPQVILAAELLIDMGPGPGVTGGNISFYGSPKHLNKANTLTADYLSGRRKVAASTTLFTAATGPKIEIEGASEHNLKHINVSLPLQRLVCITGVSGSGKSTLIQNILYPALLRIKGKGTESAGKFERLLGAELIDDVVLVDQSPIGKTTRSNPVSYVGAFDAIRQLFARSRMAKARDYKPGMFSFNAGEGRCPSCSGQGFEHVEMQFLSDVYLRCPECNGTRFRPEILEIKLELNAGDITGKELNPSIADVLEMTVSEALVYFKGQKDIMASLAPLAEVGLEYLKLGQPVPTLSGGEAQRLKLAGFLAEAYRQSEQHFKSQKGSLYLFDEPTTGLHFDDIAKLMRAFRTLLAAGHSLVVIEHNLDLISAADWLIDLGPEGGSAGGSLVGVGTPQDLMQNPQSYTGLALKEYGLALVHHSQLNTQSIPLVPEGNKPEQNVLLQTPPDSIQIYQAREHNLKGIDVAIPHHKFTVITGVSGSGKSTLAFDILFNEGQRRYLESLNAYARSMVQPASRPDVDRISGIPPTVAIEQRTSRGGRKSTVATLTEIYHFLRLLYVKCGIQYCPQCDVAVQPQTFDNIVAQLMHDYKGQQIGLLAPLVIARKGYYTDLAKWALNKGYSHLRVNGEFIPTTRWPRLDRFKEHTIELPILDLEVSAEHENKLRQGLKQALEHGHGILHVLEGIKDLRSAIEAGLEIPKLRHRVFSTNRACPKCSTSFPELDPRLFSFNSKHGWCHTCFGTGINLPSFTEENSGEENTWLNQESDSSSTLCGTCHGQRLNPTARAVRWQQKSITDLTALTIKSARHFFNQQKSLGLNKRDQEILRDLLPEIEDRLDFLQEVGLAYLALDRAAPTLSGGEAQRIRLAAQLGSNLQGVCYVLDEPTIGLHPRDNKVLLNALNKLEQQGNTLVVVEHDEDTIRRADYIIDIGPGAGVRGGSLVAQGTLQDIINAPQSMTGYYLKHPLAHPLNPRKTVPLGHPGLEIKGAFLHNLKSMNAYIPLERLSVITGVSGSGKSTLARQVLVDNLKPMTSSVTKRQQRKGKTSDLKTRPTPIVPAWIACEAIEGYQQLDRVLEVDQTPIGKTPRSCPATYIGFWDDIRKLFADTQQARIRGWTTSRFSFNTGSGRCTSCEGQGMQTIEMNFLPDVKIVCDTCRGLRFNSETISVLLRGKSIGDILAMQVDEAIDFFSAHPSIARPLKLLQRVGLGYLTLGQPSPTLSGGEAQRIKLVNELNKAKLDRLEIPVPKENSRLNNRFSNPHTLYVLDEPTVGLSLADVEKLIQVLHDLVNAGNTVVVIEHHLDIMAGADWLIDIGPEGGSEGGYLVFQGSPEKLIQSPGSSHTGMALAEFIQRTHHVN